MKVIACSEPGFASFANDLALFELIADFDIDGTQMAIEREQAQAMVNDHGIAVDAEIAHERDCAAIGRLCGIVFGDRKIVAEMVRGIDRFVVIDVGAGVGEVCFDF